MTGTEALARSSIYGLLAHLMFGYGEQLKEEILNQDAQLAMLSADLQTLFDSLVQTDPFALKLEYDNLFLVPGKFYAPPFERVYQKEGDLEELYEQVGFFLPAQIGETPDHLGCELAFMQSLVLQEQAAAEESDAEQIQTWKNLQNSFLTEHLGSWIGNVAAKVRENEPDGFYSKVLSFAEAFVAYEHTEMTC